MFLVSSSINISAFHITWLDTFWEDLDVLLNQKGDDTGTITFHSLGGHMTIKGRSEVLGILIKIIHISAI